jgi:hypothetical protein
MMRCLIIGNGANFLYEADEAKKFCTYNYTIVVKRVLYQYRGHVSAFVSLHPEWCNEYLQLRSDFGYNMGFDVYVPSLFPLSDAQRQQYGFTGRVYKAEDGWAGSSGLYAIRVARQLLGFDKIVLAGMPMDTQARYGDPVDSVWAGGDSGVHRYRRGWKQHLEHYQSQVRSMSGWTKDLLGKPDKKWLEV